MNVSGKNKTVDTSITTAKVSVLLRHNLRLISADKNTEIQRDRSHENHEMAPYIHIPQEIQYNHREDIYKLQYAKYKEWISSMYIYGKKDVNVLVSTIIDLPKELTEAPEQEKLAFWHHTIDFFGHRYADSPCISACVHKDEGGREHMHYIMIPAVKIDHEAIMKKKHAKEMETCDLKVCKADVCTKKDLLTLHPDFAAYLKDHGMDCPSVHSGITARQGGNQAVWQLKERTLQSLSVENKQLRSQLEDVTRERDQLREQLQTVTAERDAEVKQSVTWGDPISWGQEATWGSSADWGAQSAERAKSWTNTK